MLEKNQASSHIDSSCHKKGLVNKVSDGSGNRAEASNCNLCARTNGLRDCGAAQCAKAFVASESERLLLLRGRVFRKKQSQLRRMPGSPDLKGKT